jgi:hypothetical protein
MIVVYLSTFLHFLVPEHDGNDDDAATARATV